MMSTRRKTYVLQLLAGDGIWTDVSEWPRPFQAADDRTAFLAQHSESTTRIVTRTVTETEMTPQEVAEDRANGLPLYKVTRTWYVRAGAAMEAVMASKKKRHDDMTAKLTARRPLLPGRD